MNIVKFLDKLFKGGGRAIEYSQTNITISASLSPKQLQDNIELLAREMHMLVEEEKRKTYEELQKRVKHDWIEVENPNELIK